MSAPTRVQKRAAGLTVRHRSGRTYDVSSATDPTRFHVVRGAVDQPLGEWTCDCIGSGGRKNWCSHKQALSAFLGCEVVEAPTKSSFSSLRAPDGGAATATVRPAGESANGGAMREKKPGFMASIPPIMSAVKVAGDAGVRLQIDVPESDYQAVMAFVQQARGRSFRLVPMWDENADE